MAAALWATAASAGADADPKPFSMYIENDSLPLAGGDESYTQGLELQVALDRDSRVSTAILSRLKSMMGGRDTETGANYLIGQTIFTPQNIITYQPRSDDRPFVGHLYTGGAWTSQSFEWEQAEEDASDGEAERQPSEPPRRVSVRLTLGVTGDKWSLAHTAQASFHVLRESRMPKGWNTQNAVRLELNGLFVQEDVISPRNWRSWMDLTAVQQLGVGSLQTFASEGVVLRFGKNLFGFPPLSMPFSAAQAEGQGRKFPEVAVFVGAEAKVLLLNRLADQGGAGRPSFEPFVYELRAGASVQLRNGFGANYAIRRRSQEIEPLPLGLVAKHWIGSLQISKAFTMAETGASDRLGFMKGVRANLRFGRGRSTAEPSLPAADPKLPLAAHWGLEKGIKNNRLTVGGEVTGTTREHGPGDGSSHQDTFLLAKVATLGVELLPRLDTRHRLQARLGVGAALVKRQTTPAEGGISEPEELPEVTENGGAALAGLRYSRRLSHVLSLAVDASYSRLFLEGSEAGVRRAGFFTVTGGLHLHFWGRDRIQKASHKGG